MSPSIYFLLNYYKGYDILNKQADFILLCKKDGDFNMMLNQVRTYYSDIGDELIRLMRIAPHNDALHRHTFFELVYVLHGTAQHYLGTEAVRLKQGDYFIIDTGSMHCYQQTEDFQIINCLFLPEYVDRALIHCPSLSALLSNQVMRFGVPMDMHTADRIYQDHTGEILCLFEKMETEYRDRKVGYAELLRCLLTQILVEAVRASDRAEQRKPPHEATVVMAEYLRRHFDQPLSLELMSKKIGYTPQYLSALFRHDTGMTLSEYLQRFRMEKACGMLKSNMDMDQIAQAVGYSDPRYFAAVFRKVKGISFYRMQKTERETKGSMRG